MALVLMTTEACHLCELAVAVLQQVNEHVRFEVYGQDIVDDEALINRYGERIPVLVNEDNAAELDWPFDAEQVLNWLQKASSMEDSSK